MSRDKDKKRQYDAQRWVDNREHITDTHRQWRQNNLEKRAESTRRCNRKKWDYVDSHKPDVCPSCSLSFPPYCMDFHHIDETTKSFRLGQAHTKTYQQIDEEIKKCVILCACCHRKLHQGDIEL